MRIVRFGNCEWGVRAADETLLLRCRSEAVKWLAARDVTPGRNAKLKKGPLLPTGNNGGISEAKVTGETGLTPEPLPELAGAMLELLHARPSAPAEMIPLQNN